MSNITQQIKSYQKVYPQVYSYTLPTLKENDGSQKIGYTERERVEDRILEQVHSAAVKLKYQTLWHAPAFFKDGKESFLDNTFFKVKPNRTEIVAMVNQILAIIKKPSIFEIIDLEAHF